MSEWLKGFYLNRTEQNSSAKYSISEKGLRSPQDHLKAPSQLNFKGSFRKGVLLNDALKWKEDNQEAFVRVRGLLLSNYTATKKKIEYI